MHFGRREQVVANDQRHSGIRGGSDELCRWARVNLTREERWRKDLNRTSRSLSRMEMAEGTQGEGKRTWKRRCSLQLDVENVPSRIMEIVMNRLKEVAGIGHGIDEESVEIDVFTQTK